MNKKRITLNNGKEIEDIQILKRKPTSKTGSLLKELVSKRDAWSYGYGLAKKTGVSLNTIYRLIAKLSEDDLIEQKFSEENSVERHLFKLTEDGHKVAHLAIDLFDSTERINAIRGNINKKKAIT